MLLYCYSLLSIYVAFKQATEGQEVPQITTLLETRNAMDDKILSIQRIVVSRYATMHAEGKNIVNPELAEATTPVELVVAIRTAFNRCPAQIPQLLDMLGFIRKIRILADLPLRQKGE
jgi:hypothetical protein